LTEGRFRDYVPLLKIKDPNARVTLETVNTLRDEFD
jgi:hypothetical protein